MDVEQHSASSYAQPLGLNCRSRSTNIQDEFIRVVEVVYTESLTIMPPKPKGPSLNAF
jgi:hypothetical protein